MDIGVLVSQAFPYLGAVAGAYGGAVLQRLQDEATNSTVELGRRLLARLLGRDESRPAIEAAVTDLGENPDDEDLQAAVRAQVKKALADDPELAAEIGRVLADAGVPGTAKYAVTVTGSQGVQVGDGNTQTNTFGAAPA
ncbi:hypothetical protein AB0J90_28035 [Micromonospora sp. NPDC049523]|uniref:hypothetical protein n=1 Tax=Micromonospora sp. NPDC049523 TaxID=3155921 RepID=UPI003426ED2F